MHGLIALLLAAAVAPAVALAQAERDGAASVEAGRRIYQDGVLSSGQPLVGKRESGIDASGNDAACIRCHRRSGFGASEGQNSVPPVFGQALFGVFRPPGRKPRHAPGISFQDLPFRTRPPYDEESLARAIREGVSPAGYHFQYLMPRFALGDRDMAALIAYLRTLNAGPSPGAGPSGGHVATVVAPDVDADRAATYLEVLKACIAEKLPRSSEVDASGARAQRSRWQLHVWHLSGPAETWQSQLQARYAEQPVFAMVSGIGRDHWEPVHDFCEANRIPCLFPNTDAPGSAANSVYNFYFSAGVITEAKGLARYLKEGGKAGTARVVQVVRPGGAGDMAARALRGELTEAGVQVEEREYPSFLAESSEAPADRLKLGPGDALVLWLRAGDLAELVKRRPSPPAGARVFVSGTLGGFEGAALTPAWRRATHLIYPTDAPGRWELRARFNLRPWLEARGIESKDERLQGNTLAACSTFAEALYRLRGTMLRDYLIEMVELTVSEMGNTGATAAYPRLLLGPDQRFASKGTYVVRFAGPDEASIAKESDWIVP